MADDETNEQMENEVEEQLPEPVEPYSLGSEKEEEFLSEHTDGEFEENDDLEIAEETSHLASHPRRNIIMLVMIVLASATALYFILFSGDENVKQKEVAPVISKETVRNATQEVFIQEPDVAIVDTPIAPKISDIEAPSGIHFEDSESNTPNELEIDVNFDTAPPDFFETPELAAEVPEEEILLPEDPLFPDDDVDLPSAPSLEPIPGGVNLPTPEEQAAADARRRSGIMLLNGGAALGGESEGGEGGLFGGGGTTTVNSNEPQLTSATQSVATTVGTNLNSLIAQGKMIDVVLETAINTDLPGILRAIVSRDVYAESGKKVLIPRGSRLIGNYEAELAANQSRVFVVWTRIIRPDGIDIIINSPGVDPLGRAGVSGQVDSRFMEIFGNAVLLSALTVAGAYVLETVLGATESTNTTTTNSDGSSSESNTGKPTNFAIADAADGLSSTATSIVEKTVNTQPRITVVQGTKIKVFVNSDLIFPSSVSQNVRFIN